MITLLTYTSGHASLVSAFADTNLHVLDEEFLEKRDKRREVEKEKFHNKGLARWTTQKEKIRSMGMGMQIIKHEHDKDTAW